MNKLSSTVTIIIHIGSFLFRITLNPTAAIGRRVMQAMQLTTAYGTPGVPRAIMKPSMRDTMYITPKLTGTEVSLSLVTNRSVSIFAMEHAALEIFSAIHAEITANSAINPGIASMTSFEIRL